MPRTRPPYTKEYKDESVELLLSSGRPLKVLARELGMSDGALRKWRDERIGEVGSEPSALGIKESPEAELKRLRRENEYLKRQREILKKAMSILGEDPHLGMR